MHTLIRTTCLAALVAVAGCGDPAAPRSVDATPDPKSRPPEAAAAVDLLDVTYAGLDAAIKQNRGKVVLVDVWATFCGPCVKKFPHLVAVHDKYRADGLVVITVTIDEKDDREKALDFLKKQNATCSNFYLTDVEEGLKQWEDLYPVQQLPVLLAYNRKGERVLTDFGKLGKNDPTELDALVEKLLAER